jgi:hypothetical protein
MENRPEYQDYVRQLILVILHQPVVSGDRRYSLKDYPLVMILQAPIVAAMIYIYKYSPFTDGRFSDLAMQITFGMGVVLIALYWLCFVYFFAFFNVGWDTQAEHDAEPAAAGFDCWGEPEDTQENKRKIWRSRGMFGFLTLVFVGFTMLYCFLGYGTAHIRLFLLHKQELDEIATIADQYDDFYIDTNWLENYGTFVGACSEKDGKGIIISKKETEKVRMLVDRMNGLYIRYFIKDTADGDRIWLMLACKDGPFSELVWYPKEVTAQEVAKDEKVPLGSVSQLDAHWWHAWDDRGVDYDD